MLSCQSHITVTCIGHTEARGGENVVMIRNYVCESHVFKLYWLNWVTRLHKHVLGEHLFMLSIMYKLLEFGNCLCKCLFHNKTPRYCYNDLCASSSAGYLNILFGVIICSTKEALSQSTSILENGYHAHKWPTNLKASNCLWKSTASLPLSICV